MSGTLTRSPHLDGPHCPLCATLHVADAIDAWRRAAAAAAAFDDIDRMLARVIGAGVALALLQATGNDKARARRIFERAGAAFRVELRDLDEVKKSVATDRVETVAERRSLRSVLTFVDRVEIGLSRDGKLAEPHLVMMVTVGDAQTPYAMIPDLGRAMLGSLPAVLAEIDGGSRA